MTALPIVAPLPGIFHAQPNPDAPPYKQPGDDISAGEIIGLVEIMKTFHEVRCAADGQFGRYMVRSGDMVEAEQVVAELTL